MTTTDDLVLDCRTCVAANTTACSDCIVQHLVANDAGPIEFVPTTVERRPSPVERAVVMLASAGLLDDEPVFVDYATFESAGSPQLV
ncbi:MAG: hypothetical protein AB8G26_02940 [Ilumatobacter sp.]